MQEEPQYSDLLGNMFYNHIELTYHMQRYAMNEKPVRRNNEPKKKCLREGCDVLTNHNGGYCSANCCKEAKKK
jgi:hypothetical protein